MNLRLLVRHTIRSTVFYNYVRRAYLLCMKALGIPHDRDFEFFRYLDGDSGVFVDIGANGGQSAISFSCFNRTFRIVSFEPNKRLEPELRFVKKVLGGRFTYHMYGLGNADRKLTLYTPFIGSLALEARASLDDFSRESQLDELRAAGIGNAQIRTSEVEVRVFDNASIRPTCVKIDVEGHEARVLDGMRRTIAECHPIFMIEKSGSYEECRQILERSGYRLFRYDPKTRALRDIGDAGNIVNFFAVHSDQMPELRKRNAIAP